ncbi:MAG: sulfurtransferase complex subunit TusD [Gammaproteobacteria bacterium]
MKFALQINSPPYSGQGSDTAYCFAKTALQEGHAITRIFFYFDGIYNALGFSGPPDDEKNIIQRWSDLAIEWNIDLVLCVSAATRRGLAPTDDPDSPGTPGLLAKGFRISGLGQWVEAAIQAERLVVFGD